MGTRSTGGPGLVSPPDLFTKLCAPVPFVVFDIRSKEDFSKERIWSSVHLDIQTFPTVALLSSVIYRLRDNSNAITPSSSHRLFTNRELYDIVVVDEEGIDNTSLCAQLQHHMTSNQTHLLVGGYRMFSTLYPSLCVGSASQDEYLINKCEKQWMTHVPTEILPHLYFGDSESAQNFRALDLMGIEYIVNVTIGTDDFAPSAYIYKRCEFEEIPVDDLVDKFNEIFEFIENAKRKGSNVLVHGVSGSDGRTGMVVCAYLIRHNQYSLEDAFVEFRKICPTFSPNVAVLARLGDYDVSQSGTLHLSNADVTADNSQETGAHSTAGSHLVSDELKYVRRQQLRKFEEEGDDDNDGADNLVGGYQEEDLL